MDAILDSKDRKAKKEHRCDLCGEIIQKGEIYYWSKNIYDGTIYEWREHKKCQSICGAIWDYVDPDEGMSDQDFHDGCAEVCQIFVCPDCLKWNKEYEGCEDDESYCIDRLADFFETHELYREKRTIMGEIWKCREKRRGEG